MTRVLFVVPAVGLLVGCEAWIHSTARASLCANGELHPVTAASIASWDTALLLTVGVLVVWASRAGWLLVAADRMVRRIPKVDPPRALRAAVDRTDTRRVTCLAGDIPLAFCAGAFRPTVRVTETLATRLPAEHLDAVLLHEGTHCRRRDPLRYALRQSAADVFFIVPVLGWWAERGVLQAELRADRAALGRLGRKALAGAMLEVFAGPASDTIPAFHGATDLRIAQLAGQRCSPAVPSISVVAASAAGMFLLLALMWCVSQLLPAIL
jgi:beta-lactamase regulating signal transducer with metallopeptidase domain